MINVGSCNISALQLCLQAVVGSGRVRYQSGELQKAPPMQHERRQMFENVGEAGVKFCLWWEPSFHTE